MRYISTLVLAIALFSFTTKAHAQKSKNNFRIPEVKGTIVLFEINSSIDLSGNNTTRLSPKLISYFNEQNSLATLQFKMYAEENIVRINAYYVFKNLEAYQQWRKKRKQRNL